MIHNPLIFIQNFLHSRQEEQKLALKISTVSFFVLIGILTLIIMVSYYAQRERTYSDFHNEIRGFEGGKLGKGVREIFEGNTGTIPFPMNMGKDGDKEGRGPRDIIIFDRNKTILKNDYLELDNKEVSIFFTIDNNQESVIEIDNRYYLAYRKNMGDLTLFLTRDLTQLIEFHEWLILLAAIGSIIGLFIIYFLSIHLAKLMLTPIREHNTALESYSHNVAHELKTPLAVMRSNMELLKLSKSESLIDSTNEEVISMERIIDTLLLMANPKKHFHTSERIDIIALTQSIIDGYEDESIEIRGEKNKKMIEGNSELYKRVLMNLIDNARKYRSGNSIIVEIKGGVLTVQNKIEQDIDVHTLKKLTDAFYQGDTSRHTSGQGLGLALVKKIVDISGWNMSFTCKNKNFEAQIFFR